MVLFVQTDRDPCIQRLGESEGTPVDGRKQAAWPVFPTLQGEVTDTKCVFFGRATKDNLTIIHRRHGVRALLSRLEKSSERDSYEKVPLTEHSELMALEREPSPETPEYYMPHHGVVRQDAVTTKLRVVFDASSRDYGGRSLNNL